MLVRRQSTQGGFDKRPVWVDQSLNRDWVREHPVDHANWLLLSTGYYCYYYLLLLLPLITTVTFILIIVAPVSHLYMYMYMHHACPGAFFKKRMHMYMYIYIYILVCNKADIFLYQARTSLPRYCIIAIGPKG